MKLILTPLLFCLVSVLLIHPCFAQEAKKKTTPLRLLLSAGLEFGGDKIAEVYFTNGEKQGVRAGQGISVGVGGQLQIPGAERFLLRATAGFKYVTTAADNVHIRLTRIPIIITGNYMAAPKLRIGAGLSMHQAIRFKTGGLGGDHEFNAASGPTFEVAYAGVGLTYTAMKYTDNIKSYSANAIGVSFSLTLPNR